MELEEFMQLLKEKKLSEVKNSLLEMNEFDIASLIEELPEDKIVQAFRLLPKNMATDVFVNMDDEIQKKLISSLTSTESKAIIEDMFTDDAADLFEEMPAIMVRRLLSNIDKNTPSLKSGNPCLRRRIAPGNKVSRKIHTYSWNTTLSFFSILSLMPLKMALRPSFNWSNGMESST